MIGRKKEISILNAACDKSGSSLIAIYGRRRIGKTFLVNYLFKTHRKDCMFFEFTGAYKLSTEQQISNFIEQVYTWFRIEPTKEIKNWTEAFNFLKRTLRDKISENKDTKKVTLFFDEVPWVDKSNKAGFIAALGYFWNTFCETEANFVVILCGSNASWIKNKILDDGEGPLYRRVTDTLAMKPFDLAETKRYLLEEKKFRLDDRSVTEIYMVFGGVAKYLSYLNPMESVSKNIDNLFFTVGGALYDEFNIVFKSLFQTKASIYKEVITLLSTKTSGFTINQIKVATTISSRNTLVSVLDELELCGFILGTKKLGNLVKDIKYVITDSLSIFYTKWVKDKSKNDIGNLPKPYWSSVVNTNYYAVWRGFRFETICLSNIHLYTKARSTDGLSKGAYYWSYIDENDAGKGAQINIVVEYGNGVYDIVECKYYNDEFIITADYARTLINKVEQFEEHGLKKNTKKDIKLIMLTTFGSKHNAAYNTANVAMDITLNDLLS